MEVIILILLIIILSLLLLIISYKKDIRYISRQISKSKGDLTNIKMSSLNKEIEELGIKIDELYLTNHKINLKIRNNEEKLRESIENMSHDLRTPLTSIMGFVQLLKDEQLSKEEKLRYISIIERRTENLNTLINCFYDLSRIENNEYKFKLEYVNLSEILVENIAAFYDDFINNGIEPKIQIAENRSNVIADKNAVMRIFSNLINNMIKHGDKSVDISLYNVDNYVETEFINSAPNLKPEEVEKIFDRFYTGDAARTDKSTGLGLCITKALVEQMGHKIEANLENGSLKIKIRWQIKRTVK
ncbi:sensor histidine kinase [Inconstantimicrobium mannanitabidum]|uniref:Two-component sensor histidine kinase n=1 Tax=Inconstantimicrobium mannanitabidum TaxID=1604901 RepID=A0ACB5RG99_9CLOT|nr:HAMP domain-containing sensor histidine kinase [Clostridium sp. TW13]GKX68113.1 two-component sensor histidine kinase [Clostridium sp. TW13]